MKKTLLPLLVLSICVIILGGSVGIAKPAEAHRSGCHRWHSCPSDTGSYTCGADARFTRRPFKHISRLHFLKSQQ